MVLRISGKSVDVGESFRTNAEERIAGAVTKYFDGGYTGHVTVEREGSGFKTECAIHLDTGAVMTSEGSGHDALKSFDVAAEHIEKQLRRYKRRLKGHHHGDPDDAMTAGREPKEEPAKQ